MKHSSETGSGPFGPSPKSVFRYIDIVHFLPVSSLSKLQIPMTGFDCARSNNVDVFKEYSSWIRKVLNQSENRLKNGLKSLISSLILHEMSIKIVLSGVNRKALYSSVFASAPLSCL